MIIMEIWSNYANRLNGHDNDKSHKIAYIMAIVVMISRNRNYHSRNHINNVNIYEHV